MKQADLTNIIFGPWVHAPGTPSPIERLWKRYGEAHNEKLRIYAEVETAAEPEAVTHAALDALEAAADAAFDKLWDIADEILRSRVTSEADLDIQSRVLMRRDHGNGYRREEVERFCRNVQIAAGFFRPQDNVEVASQ